MVISTHVAREWIPISEGMLLLRCLCKVGLPLQSKTWNHSHPEMIWFARDIPPNALLKLMILYLVPLTPPDSVDGAVKKEKCLVPIEYLLF